MVKTRAMHRRSLSKRRSYRRRVKSSACRGKSPAVCRSMDNCKFVGKRRRFCRKSSNKRRRHGGAGMRRGGAGMRRGGAGTRRGGAGMRRGGAGMRRGGAGTRRGGRRRRKAGNPAIGTPLVLLGANTLLKPKTVRRALRGAKL